MTLWTAHELARAAGGRLAVPASGDAALGGVSIDSRTLAPGDAFFAIRGDRFDGHDFVADALAAGAGLAVVAAGRAGAFGREPRLMVVEEVLAALADCGRAARARTDAAVVAVTGSVGKTGTKEALRLALTASGATHAASASHNNHWGVPLSLARMPKESRYGVFEIGMNHPGEITPLTGMVRPHLAIVTTVAPVHVGFFASVEAIADAKAEIFVGLEPGGIAVINADNPHSERLAAAARAAGAARIVRFGERGDADVRLTAFAAEAAGSRVEADVFGAAVGYRIGQPGRHVAHNSLAVLAAVALVGADLRAGAEALVGLSAPRGRGRQLQLRLRGGEALLIDESYNANPASVRAAIALLAACAPGAGGRRIAVLGDMLELGEAGPAYHRDLATDLAAAGIARVDSCGPLMRHLHAALPDDRRGSHADDAGELIAPLLREIGPGDVVMVKGSNAMRMSRIVEALAQHAAMPVASEG